MAYINISRLFDMSQALSTQAGQQLQGFLYYMAQLASETVRNLKNGLDFADNFACEIKSINVLNQTDTVVLPVTNQGRVTQIMIRQVVDQTYYSVNSFGWYYGSNGNLLVNIGFLVTPPSNYAVNVELIIFFA